MKVLSKETRQLPYGNGQVAVVEVDGARLHFSRYDNEQRWLADAAFIPAHNADGQPLTEELLNARIKEAGTPTAIVCNGFHKRKINSFIHSSRHYEPGVDVYESDVGSQRVILSRWVPADKILLLDLDKLQVMPLQGRSFFVKPLAESGNFRKAQLIGEYTLEVLGKHGVIGNLATS